MRFGWGNTLPILLLACLPLVAIATGAPKPAHDSRSNTMRVMAPAAGSVAILSAANTADGIGGR
jgi:hypothetical protein